MHNMTMPNWNLYLDSGHDLLAADPRLLLREIAHELRSETAFLLIPHSRTQWIIPDGWFYSENGIRPDRITSGWEDLIHQAIDQEWLLIDTDLWNNVPDTLARVGIDSAITVAVGCSEKKALLVVCGAKALVGRPPFQVHYSLSECNLTRVLARVLSLNGMGKIIEEMIDEKGLEVESAWDRDPNKEHLLSKHKGSFIAYCDGKPVALARSISDLLVKLDEKLGCPRKPCEVFEITDSTPPRRSPSPRGNPHLAP